MFALSIFHASPKAYRLFRKAFTLPGISTLKNYMSKIDVSPGFQDNILSALKLKVESMSERAKYCTLVFDEVSIKEWLQYDISRDRIAGMEDFGGTGRTKHIANHASVFMVRGLFESWKQPFGFFLLLVP